MCVSLSLKDSGRGWMTHVTDVETGAYEIDNMLKLKVGQGLEAS